MDDKGTPDVFRHGEHSYPVLNIIVKGSLLLNEECNNEEEEEACSRESIINKSITLISDRMISLFFQEVEGPDRDWSEPYEFNKKNDDYADQSR